MAGLRHSREKRKPRRYLSKTVLLIVCVLTVPSLGIGQGQGNRKSKPAPRPANLASGNETFLQYCASCHGKLGKGDGPAALAMKAPPPDLTTLANRHDGKYPAGYVSAVLKFGRGLASHGSEEMPVWGSRFRSLDPARDPTGQQHMDDVVAYIQSLQVK